MQAPLNSCLLFFLIFAQGLLQLAGTPPKKNEIVLFDGKNLDNWAVTDYAGKGNVTLDRNESVSLEFGIALTGIHWIGKPLPKINYEIHWESKREMGTDFFGSLTFPFLESHATLVLGGWGGALVGISCIDGFDASENETATAHLFNLNQWYDCRLQVTKNYFKFWVDQEKLIDCDVAGRDISMRSGEIEMSIPLGFSTFDTTGQLRNVVLKRLESKDKKKAQLIGPL